MPCTTLLVGPKASNNGATIIGRTDDGFFDVKKLIVVRPEKQPKKYKSVIGKLTIELPKDPLSYTSSPSVDPKNGVWPACGINEANVAMTATETITSNPLVLAADPMVRFEKAKKRGEKDKPGGIGEEDLVLLVLPYIRSAREGVLRLGELLETYGTYEPNGIGFSDENEVWWFESIGGHHWIAKKVKDDEVVVMPNQLGIDSFDLDDAFGKKKAHLCSEDLREFIEKNHLDCNQGGVMNPRNVFGSHSDSDHVYNTPRAWFMGRYLCPTKYRWDGPDADFTPESDNIPWSFVPERKLTVEDAKYLLSSYYQGTPYNPYSNTAEKKGMYRSIGINRTGVTGILEIRKDVPDPLKGIEWVCFGPTSFDAALPVYTGVTKMPKYLSDVTLDVSTENFYWGSRLISVMADPHYASCIQIVERYQQAVAVRGRRLIREYDEKMAKEKSFKLAEEANEKLCEMAREETQRVLNSLMLEASKAMKNGYNRADN